MVLGIHACHAISPACSSSSLCCTCHALSMPASPAWVLILCLALAPLPLHTPSAYTLLHFSFCLPYMPFGFWLLVFMPACLQCACCAPNTSVHTCLYSMPFACAYLFSYFYDPYTTYLLSPCLHWCLIHFIKFCVFYIFTCLYHTPTIQILPPTRTLTPCLACWCCFPRSLL